MPLLDLNNCFPEPMDASKPRGPLPKQALFMRLAFQEGPNPKYIRYVGGVGSGKSLIGCITVLSWAVQYPGDYLIARQFMPELRDTTYRVFKEICPAELIIEDRIADAVMKIKTANGGVSTILFRGLEEPDKLRSLNLNAFYIDEANQVTEYAFQLLQTRLRGRYVRKGIITQNSGGHDWSWRWFVKQDFFQKEETKKLFANIVAPTIENIHLATDYIENMMQTWSSERVQRELYANEDSFEGQVYTEFRRDTHVIKPFAIPKEWTRVVGADHGFRNPSAWIWGAVDGDDNIYIYREFYEKEWLIEEICKGKKNPITKQRVKDKPGVIELSKGEVISGIYIDPSTRARRGLKGHSEFDEYRVNLPNDWPLLLADNEKTAGIEKVKQYLKLNPKTNKPRLYIFDTCSNLIDELTTYRYAELSPSRIGKINEKEEPQKVHDHANDALRYLIMSFPEPNVENEDWYKKTGHAYNSLEGQLHRDLELMRNPIEKDPFGD